jgi:hypothetical protein
MNQKGKYKKYTNYKVVISSSKLSVAMNGTDEITDCVQFIVIVCGTDSTFHVHASLQPYSLCSFRGTVVKICS